MGMGICLSCKHLVTLCFNQMCNKGVYTLQLFWYTSGECIMLQETYKINQSPYPLSFPHQCLSPPFSWKCSSIPFYRRVLKGIFRKRSVKVTGEQQKGITRIGLSCNLLLLLTCKQRNFVQYSLYTC